MTSYLEDALKYSKVNLRPRIGMSEMRGMRRATFLLGLALNRLEQRNCHAQAHEATSLIEFLSFFFS